MRTWQSLGFTAQFVVGLSQPGNNFLQAMLLAPLMVLSLGCLYALDRFVRPIEAPAAGTAGGKASVNGHWDEDA